MKSCLQNILQKTSTSSLNSTLPRRPKQVSPLISGPTPAQLQWLSSPRAVAQCLVSPKNRNTTSLDRHHPYWLRSECCLVCRSLLLPLFPFLQSVCCPSFVSCLGLRHISFMMLWLVLHCHQHVEIRRHRQALARLTLTMEVMTRSS